MNHRLAVSATRERVNGLDVEQEQRCEHHVQPHRCQHQGPQRRAIIRRLGPSGQAEMPRDHLRRPGRGGQGSRLSKKPHRPMNSARPTKKATPTSRWKVIRLSLTGLPSCCPGGKHWDVTTPQHRADRFIDAEGDPREGGPSLGNERATLIEFLRGQRLTLQLKCEGLDAGQLARRSVEPSTMSLLGLLRHLADVERKWFRQRFAGQDLPTRYQSDAEPDGDFDGAVADQAIVDDAWAAWRDEVAFAEQFARDTDLH